MKRLVERIKHSFFASHCRCIVCGGEMREKCKYMICHACTSELNPIDSIHCSLCGRQLYGEEMYCFSCQNNHRDYDMARALYIYNGTIVKILRNYKFHNARYMARYLAEMVRDCYVKYHMDCDVIVTVPISTERHSERGYNQSQLIAEELVAPRGSSVNNKLPPYVDKPYLPSAIAKTANNMRQTALTRVERQKNVLGVYAVINKDAIKGKRILVIDDIMTTGATCSEVARVLKAAGAAEVNCILIAIADHHIELDREDEQ